MNTEFQRWFTNDERQFMARLSNLLRQSEAVGNGNEQVFLDMEAEGDRFDEVHGEGSVDRVLSRIRQAIAWKERRRQCAMRGLSGSRVGDLATWLNAADAEFLAQIGVTL